LPDTPVVAFYSDVKKDFLGHNRVQYVFGHIPNNAKIEFNTEDNKEWLISQVLLYTDRPDQIGEISKKIVGHPQSLELDPKTVSYEIVTQDGKQKVHFSKGRICGLSVLGMDQKPAFAGAAFFSLQSENGELKEKFENFFSRLEEEYRGQQTMKSEKFKSLLQATELSYTDRERLVHDAFCLQLGENTLAIIEEMYDDYVIFDTYDMKNDKAAFQKAQYTLDKDNVVTFTSCVEVFKIFVTAEEQKKLEGTPAPEVNQAACAPKKENAECGDPKKTEAACGDPKKTKASCGDPKKTEAECETPKKEDAECGTPKKNETEAACGTPKKEEANATCDPKKPACECDPKKPDCGCDPKKPECECDPKKQDCKCDPKKPACECNPVAPVEPKKPEEPEGDEGDGDDDEDDDPEHKHDDEEDDMKKRKGCSTCENHAEEKENKFTALDNGKSQESEALAKERAEFEAHKSESDATKAKLEAQLKDMSDKLNAATEQIKNFELAQKKNLINSYGKELPENIINDCLDHINDLDYKAIESKLAISFAEIHRKTANQSNFDLSNFVIGGNNDDNRASDNRESEYASLVNKYKNISK
jgi:hypothetical protein